MRFSNKNIANLKNCVPVNSKSTSIWEKVRDQVSKLSYSNLIYVSFVNPMHLKNLHQKETLDPVFHVD